MFRISVFVLILVGITGCTTRSVPKDFTFDATEAGVAVVSVTSDLIRGHQRKANSIFYVNGQIHHPSYRQLESSPMGLFGPSKSEFTDVRGRLIAFKLPAGQHELTSWKINAGAIHFTPKNEPKPLVFSITQGEIVYLGNLHMRLEVGKSALGFIVIATGWPEIRDEADRDIPLLESRYPNFKGQVIKRVLPAGPWDLPP